MSISSSGKATDLLQFTRASNATVTDSDGRVKWAPHNLLLNSESFDAASWAKTSVTPTANSIAAPNGTTTADTLAASGANGTTLQTFTAEAISYTFAVWLKRKTGAGNIQIAADSGTYTTVTITSDWALYTVTQTPTAGSKTAGIRIVTSADEVYAWGASAYRSDLGGMQPNTSAYPLYNPTTPKNLLGYTEDFSNAAWTKSNILAFGSGSVANAILAPNGLQTADLITPDTTNNLHRVFANDPFPSSTKLLFACYAKSNGYTKLGLRETGTTGAGAAFDLTGSGSVIGAYNSGGSTVSDMVISSVGNGWFRISCVFSFASATGMRFAVNLLSPSYVSGDLSASWTADGTSGIYLWGAQFSDSASLDTYVPNYGAAPTAAAYYGPRLDFDPVTLAAKGLLVEESRANVLLRSASFDNSVWDNASPNSATVATNIVSPDGGTTGQTLTAATGGTGSMRRQSVSIAGATTYSFSIFIKQGTSTSSRLLVRDETNGTNFIQATAITWSSGVPSIGGTTGTWATPVAVGNGWYRISGSAAAGAGATITVLVSIFPDNSAGTGTLLVYGAQLEAGSFATSYIPTGAATATRSADVASVSTQAFPYSATEGTLVANVSTFDTSSNLPTHINLSDGTTSNYIRMNAQPTSYKLRNYVRAGGADVVNSTIGGVTVVNDPFKAGVYYKTNSFNSSVNGAISTEVTTGAVPSAATTLSLGNWFVSAGTFLNGHIRQITYLPRRISNAELQTRTT